MCKKCEKMCFKNAILKTVQKLHFKNAKKCEENVKKKYF